MASGAVYRQLDRAFNGGGVSGLTEGQLLERFVSRRDDSAFEALVARHGPMVYAVCRRQLRDSNDVDDAFQAVFLVLVRKAASLRKRELLGNWLYGVAFKVASRARTLAARRPGSGSLDDLPAVPIDAADPGVYEEVHRLPEKYRAPVVLCYLEGLTHEEAADRLSWPVGTVKGRLSRARDLLKGRLTRRGVTLAAAASALDLLRRDVPAALAQRLAVSTTSGAVAAVSSGPLAASAAGLISGPAVALSEGVIHAMSLTTIKTIAAVLFIGAITTGAGVAAFQEKPAPKDGKKGAETPAASPADQPSDAAKVATTNPAAPEADTAQDLKLFRRWLDQVHEWSGDRIDELSDFSYTLRKGRLKVAATEEEAKAIAEAHVSRQNLVEAKVRDLHRVANNPKTQRLWNIAAVYKQKAMKEAREGMIEDRPTNYVPFSKLITEDGIVKPNPPTVGLLPDPGPAPGQAGRGLQVNLPAAGTMPGAATPAQPAALPGTPIPVAGGGGIGRGMAPAMPGAGGGGIGEGTGPANPTGGGFDAGFGGGASDAGEQDHIMRLEIGRLAPKVARLDETPASKEILKTLDRPIDMNFSDETPLADVLNFIKSSTTSPDGKSLPIYVDKVALAESDLTINSPVTIELQGIPLKAALRLALKQLGLAYCVRDGILIISSVRGIHQELLEAAGSSTENTPTSAGMPGMMGGMGGGFR